MKKPAILSLSMLTLSAMMAIETPVLAATHINAPTALVSNAVPTDQSASNAAAPLTSRTAYGVIYNNAYANTTNDLLKKFNQLNKDLYMSEGLSDSFAYFNADKYLTEYADVKDGLTAQLSDAEKNDQDALRKAALNHYVDYGMLEGRDCGTSFNPVIALLAYPELYKDASDLSPDQVRKIFLDNIHAEDTSEFSIYFYNINDTEMLSIVRSKKDSSSTKYTLSDVLADAGISTGGSSASKDSSDMKETSDRKDNSNREDNSDRKDNSDREDNSDRKDSSDTEKPSGDSSSEKRSGKDSTVPFVVPEKLNNKAKNLIPYKLYSLTGNSNELDRLGTATTNYELIKDKLTNKYTMMIYMCGTNLERDHRNVSWTISSLLQTAPKNMNIVLLLGGTDSYHSTYLNEMIGKEKTGIYYLNPDKVPKDIDWDNLYRTHNYDQVINKDTVVNLSKFDYVPIGEPGLLSGFMDLSSDLFPAEDYGLIMLNHGAGVVGGICIPDHQYITENKRFNIDDLESAFRSSKLIKSGRKLGLLAFDACEMGSSEIAYNLHNYYNYMYASEDIERGRFDYQRIFTAMDSQLGDGTATDYSMIKTIHDNFSYKDGTKESHTAPSYFQQTGAVFDAASSEKFATALNDMGKQLNKLIQVAPENGKGVLHTLANARMKCEQLGISTNSMYKWGSGTLRYVDAGELAYYLKSDLTALKEQAVKAGASDDYINAIQNSIDSVCALQKTGCVVMTSTWYNRNMIRSYTGQQATSMEDMQAKAPMSDFWRKSQGTAASYGATVYFPFILNVPKKETFFRYSNFYKGTSLSDYSDLMTTMIKWQRSDEYTTQKEALTKELAKNRLFASSEVKDLGDKISPQYLVVNFKDHYDENNRPADSFGSPMYDALVTMDKSPRIYASCSFTDKEGNPVTDYKKIALINDESGEHFNLADSSMNIPLNTLGGFGIYQKGTASETDLDCKLTRWFKNDSKLICAVNNEYKDADRNQYKIVLGGYDGVNTYDNVFHVFHQTGDQNVFEYTGTGQYCKETNNYKKVENIKQVSFYNYYLHKTEDNSTERINPWDQKSKEDLEKLTNYSIEDKANPIYLKRFTLGTGGAVNLNPDNFTYNASIAFTYKNENGKTITTTQFSDEATPKKADAAENVKADADAKADNEIANSDTDTKATTDENVNADTKVAADENANADAKAAADENANADTTDSVNTDADITDSVNTDHAQEAGAEPEASETPEITEK